MSRKITCEIWKPKCPKLSPYLRYIESSTLQPPFCSSYPISFKAILQNLNIVTELVRRFQERYPASGIVLLDAFNTRISYVEACIRLTKRIINHLQNIGSQLHYCLNGLIVICGALIDDVHGILSLNELGLLHRQLGEWIIHFHGLILSMSPDSINVARIIQQRFLGRDKLIPLLNVLTPTNHTVQPPANLCTSSLETKRFFDHIQDTKAYISKCSLTDCYLIEYYNDVNDGHELNKLEALAQLLQTANPDIIALLECIKYENRRLIYQIPFEFGRVVVLSRLIYRQQHLFMYEFHELLLIMKKITCALSYLHSRGYVHGRLCADHVLLLNKVKHKGDGEWDESQNDSSLGTPVLIGFHQPWSYKAYYTYPYELHVHTELEIGILNDIYALGIIFLELTLKRSVREFYNSDKSMIRFNGIRNVEELSTHERLIGLVESENLLSDLMGRIIWNCLHCFEMDIFLPSLALSIFRSLNRIKV